jgi:hypothetical protein
MDNITSQVPANPPGMPGNPTQTSDAAPVVAAAAGGALMIVLIVIGVILGGMVLCGVGAGILMVAVSKARESGRRIECSNDMRQIGIACHNIHDTLGTFPTDVNSPTGSGIWVDILPFVENNQKVMICPSRRPFNSSTAGKSDYGYAATSGTGSAGKSIFDTPGGLALKDLSDPPQYTSAGKTLMLAHLWMSPANYAGGDPTDVGYQTKKSSRSINDTAMHDADPSGSTSHIGGPHPGASPCLFADCHIQPIPYGYAHWAEMWAWNNTKPFQLPTK